jgi:hypothetical protein
MSKKIIISLIIVIWFLIQTYIGFFGIKEQWDTWPFTTYSMYAQKIKPGDRAIQLRLFGHTVSGRIIEITPEDFGMPNRRFLRDAWPNILNPGTRKTYASELISIYNQRQKKPSQKLKDLQIISESRVITRNGPSELFEEILFTYKP